jgi:hypothetical protein
MGGVFAKCKWRSVTPSAPSRARCRGARVEDKRRTAEKVGSEEKKVASEEKKIASDEKNK